MTKKLDLDILTHKKQKNSKKNIKRKENQKERKRKICM